MKKKTSLALFMPFVYRYYALFICIMLCACAVGAVDIAAPYLIGKAIDEMAPAGAVNFTAIFRILWILVLCYTGHALFKYLMQMLSVRTAYRIVEQMRQRAFEHLQRLPLRYYDTTAQGDIVSRFINDADTMVDGLLQGITQLFYGIVIIVGTLLFMLSQSVAVTVIVILVTSLNFVVANVVTRTSAKHFAGTQMLVGELNGYAQEIIGGYKTVKTFGYEEEAQKRFDAINARLYRAGQKSQFAGSLTNPTTRFVNNLAYICVGVGGGIIAGLSAGGISSFIIYATQFARPFNEITGVWAQIMAAASAARRIFDLMEVPPETSDEDSAILRDVSGNVEFRNVDFSYDPDRPLIQNFNLQARAGQKIAIVGPTGAGKSTIINLLMRYYDVDAGAIYIDGVDIRKVRRDTLRTQFAMVLQETWSFDGTIRENIAYGKEDATEEEIRQAAKRAYADGFIRRLSHGYDTRIQESGGILSGGQRQLLTIARAMLLDPPMLILDEATSSIDTLTEQNITKAFNKLMEGRTSFIIAHRLSTIRGADTILVMDKGAVVEQGSHSELMEKQGFYYRLYMSQFEQE